ncbi:hypothetical protein GCM10029964_014800 [Kibdelosporangium lantanae]
MRSWAGKQLGTSLLPDLVAEAVRAPLIAVTSTHRTRSTTDERVAAALALAEQYAAEEAREARPSAPPWHLGEEWSTDRGGEPRRLAGLLAGAA